MPITVTSNAVPPQIDLFLSSLPAGTKQVEVWRSWSGQQSRVRGDRKAVVVGSEAVLTDYDVPVGRAVTYRARCFAVDGSELAGLAETAPVTIALAADANGEPTTAWLSDPLTPGLARFVLLDGETDLSRSYPVDAAFAQVIGQRLPTVSSSARSAPQDWTFTIKAYSFEESTAIEALVAGGGTLLIRPSPVTVRHTTGLIYLAATQVQEIPRRDLVYEPQRADWVIAGREVRPPGLAVTLAPRDWEDVYNENADWAEVYTKYDDWLGVLRG